MSSWYKLCQCCGKHQSGNLPFFVCHYFLIFFTMKKCPFCAEEIADEAIKCKHCWELLDKKSESDRKIRIDDFMRFFHKDTKNKWDVDSYDYDLWRVVVSIDLWRNWLLFPICLFMPRKRGREVFTFDSDGNIDKYAWIKFWSLVGSWKRWYSWPFGTWKIDKRL